MSQLDILLIVLSESLCSMKSVDLPIAGSLLQLRPNDRRSSCAASHAGLLAIARDPLRSLLQIPSLARRKTPCGFCLLSKF